MSNSDSKKMKAGQLPESIFLHFPGSRDFDKLSEITGIPKETVDDILRGRCGDDEVIQQFTTMSDFENISLQDYCDYQNLVDSISSENKILLAQEFSDGRARILASDEYLEAIGYSTISWNSRAADYYHWSGRRGKQSGRHTAFDMVNMPYHQQVVPTSAVRYLAKFLEEVYDIQVVFFKTGRVSDMNKETLRIFLSYSSLDVEYADGIYKKLKAKGFNVWFDRENLLPGQNWDSEIRAALSESDVILICLSENATDRIGYLQREIKIALDYAEEMPDGLVYVVPARVENCQVPQKLKKWQWVDLHDSKGIQKLYESLVARSFDPRRRNNRQ